MRGYALGSKELWVFQWVCVLVIEFDGFVLAVNKPSFVE